ncbi:MAG: glycoside hydrolase family 13 protein [Bacteroides sp.]|nr:glycoside hydrolase family 13 protein [Bacteroides sp.]
MTLVANNIDIDPPHWWVGMKNKSLQLQIHAAGVRDAQFSVDYPGVIVDSVVRLDKSPNWQYVYLNLSPDTKPGKLKLKWTLGKKKYNADYELKARKTQKGAKGFSSADVLYLIMPDRFADGNPENNVILSMKYPATVDRKNPNIRHGGDISGILKHIDYIDSLGVTAVWVNPVLENDMPFGSYHGYATTDYYAIDPRFGSNDDYAAVIDSLHNRGIKTIMDMIFNHSGSNHPWVLDPPSSDWFNLQDNYQQTNYRLSTIQDPYSSKYDKSLSVDGWFVHEMPDLNQKNPHLMKYLVQNSIWWIEESDIDAIRMDTYPYADIDAMAGWIDDVENEYPDFTIVGECWYSDPGQVSYWQTGSALGQKDGVDTHLPVVMDFPFMIKSKGMEIYNEKTDPWNGLNKVYDHLSQDFVYDNPMNVLRFLDNHDTERFLTAPIDSLDNWKQALAILLTIPGIPQLYYGTELLMSGTREGGDGMVRQDMPGGFPGDSVNIFSKEGRSQLQNEAYDYISKILRWRKNSNAIANGNMKHFMPTNGIYLYQRSAGDDKAVVMLNGTDERLDIDMTRYEELITRGSKWKDILTGEIIEIIPQNGQRIFSPRETRILIPE